MKSERSPQEGSSCCTRSGHNVHRRHRAAWADSLLGRWFMTNSIIAGLFALAWLILRSGTKPSRFAYPCQQAAISAATLAFGAPVVAAILALRRHLVAGLRKPVGLVAASLGLVLTVGLWGYFAQADPYTGPRLDPPEGYRAQLYRVIDCPEDPVGDYFVGFDNLMELMGRHDLKFYQSDTVRATSGPEGIIGADDVVLLKFNYQWGERGGTNTDLLRGVIARILDHPDHFDGEIVIVENTQFIAPTNFDRSANNAQDTGQSPRDVVQYFRNAGYAVSQYDWTPVRTTLVDEYSEGDDDDGYVRYAYNSALHGRVSYPKFESELGTKISLRDGIWDPDRETYDREHLKFINMPVLKSHHATYGITACVKHYMGVVTGELNTNSHGAIYYGILGAQMAEIGMADLNILDCIWINADPNTGPTCAYSGATRKNQLIASVDPVATDIWAAVHILIPAFYENGFTPPWPYPTATPTDPTSMFRRYLDSSMEYLLDAGFNVTNDLDQIDVYTWDGLTIKGDATQDGLVTRADSYAFADCLSGVGEEPTPEGDMTRAECVAIADFDADSDVDLSDFAMLQNMVGYRDCNRNETHDQYDVDNGISDDCNRNNMPDECDVVNGDEADCDGNLVPDVCDIEAGDMEDCNHNYVGDSCEVDSGDAEDCNGNYIPDECDVAMPVPSIVDDIPAVHGFVDISVSGNALNLGDDTCINRNMSWSNMWTGTRGVRICNNGGLGFTSSGDLGYENGEIPSDIFGGAAAMIPYWDDLAEHTGNVYYGTIGAAPNRTFIVSWVDRPHYYQQPDNVLDGTEVTFQVQIFETATVDDVLAQFVYEDLDFENTEFDNGASATVGFQEDSAYGSMYSMNQSGSVYGGVVLSVVGGLPELDQNQNGIPDDCE